MIPIVLANDYQRYRHSVHSSCHGWPSVPFASLHLIVLPISAPASNSRRHNRNGSLPSASTMRTTTK
jgi:hypothetical protein